MSTWILTLGLQNLLRQINEWSPDRDHASDGTIGDTAHQAERSGHNPDDTPGSRPEWNGDSDSTPEVRAIDIDADFRNGVTAQQFVDHIVGLRPTSVLRYVIYNRRIYQAAYGWLPLPYDGPSAHTEHIHFSGAYSQTADNNTTYAYRLDVIPVALTADDKAWISQQIAAATTRQIAMVTSAATALGQQVTAVTAFDKPQADGTPTSKIGQLTLDQGIPNGTRDGQPRDQAWKVLQDIGTQIVALQAQVAVIAAGLAK